MDFDIILSHTGEFSKFQIFLFSVLCFSAIPSAMHVMSSIFTSATPEYRCFVEGCDNVNTSYLTPWLQNFSKSNRNNVLEGNCYQYHGVIVDSSTSGCPPIFNDSNTLRHSKKLECHKWKFDESFFQSTTVTEWNLVCNRGWLSPLSGSIWMIGVTVGAIGFGYMSDRFGRKLTLMISIVINLISNFIIPFSINYTMFLCTRFLLAAASTGVYQCSSVILIEFVGNSKRVFCGMSFSFAFGIGEILLGVLAYFERDWRKLQLWLAIPSIFFLSYYWFVPESVRWLILRKRYQAARDIISKMASVNNIILPKELMEGKENETEQKSYNTNSASFFDLFRSPILRWRTIILFLNWGFIVFGYYGISMNSVNLGGDIYINYMLASVVELPAFLISWFILDRIGRRIPLVTFLCVGGICCIISAFVPKFCTRWATIILVLIGKFGVAAAFSIIILFTSELLPTSVRTTGTGVSAFFAHAGAMLAPYVASLTVYASDLPLLIFGFSLIIASCLAFNLPETLGQLLPESIKDAENLSKCKINQPAVQVMTISVSTIDQTKERNLIKTD